MMLSRTDIQACRRQFPALTRLVGQQKAAFLDGAAGTQVPKCVIDAIGQYLENCNANHGGLFATSMESDRLLDQVHTGVAEFLGASDPDCVSFGPNMTTLTLGLSRALARTWKEGDEVVVTRLEHDANFSPWVLAARDAGATVREVGICAEDCTLDLDDLRSKINERTKLVAVGRASNIVGTINPVAEISGWAHEVGALVFVDAVHYAPHGLIDVEQFGCDFLACSAYKFFGPHVGILWGRRQLLEDLEAYKLRPAPDDLPGKWMNGTQNHECLAGTLAAVDYLAELGRTVTGEDYLTRRDALISVFAAIGAYEKELGAHLISGLKQFSSIRIFGITNPDRFDERVPTVSFRHETMSPAAVAEELGGRGFFSWHGNSYALPLTSALGLEPEGVVRVGLVHYNTREEVDRLLAAVADLR